MTIVMTMDLPVAKDDVEAVSAGMHTHENPPMGLIVHTATETANGVHVVDVWESQADYEKFRDEMLMPAMEKYLAEHNMTMDAAPQPTLEDAFDVVRGR